mmetsp:Transcript_79807/g.222167  ORF Transcript_79807/g.222167 Transcript_79807/m.222167 type:complete len:240 (+) Transcript_79807:91-810(+)
MPAAPQPASWQAVQHLPTAAGAVQQLLSDGFEELEAVSKFTGSLGYTHLKAAPNADPPHISQLQKPLPQVGFGYAEWNVDRCGQGITCPQFFCKCWHSEVEKRCPNFARHGSCEDARGGPRCPHGLHIQASSVNQTLCVNLENPFECNAQVQRLWNQTPETRASYCRVVLYGFASLRAHFLKRILQCLPLVYELVLPDREKNLTLLVYLCDLVEGCAQICPRLREVVFKDGSSEVLWSK